ncbi:MAG: xanthine dehydrogenase family protein molybdopterin-binding subunit [Firmicutes bacterium]|nr:xanthine dehydrogenase family protein molybdopterin-binding subunit [Bacillota bacterium]
MSQFRSVNHPVRRVDAYEKVTGRAKYAADLRFDGMVWGKVLRSRYPHARIRSINAEKARSLPGVLAVLTAQDVPGAKTFGIVVPNQYLLADDRVRYLGDGVALVAAETESIAQAALALIEVEYEELPGVFDPLAALEKGAPTLHAEAPDNLAVHHHVQKGDLAAGMAEADLVLEREYRTQFIEHAYIEPEAVLALPTHPFGHYLTIYGSFQNIYNIRRSVAKVLALPLNRVRLVQATLGGSFGGKDEVMHAMAGRAALLAQATGRPVKMVNSREESILESYKRHPYILRYQAGVKKDGTISAMKIEVYADAGAYASMTPFVTWRSVVQATGPYQVPHVRTDIYGVYTNNTYTGAMRGFGSPQVCFANESFMDEIALELGMDPIEFRMKNALVDGSVTATGQVLNRHRVSLKEVLSQALEAVQYQDKVREYRRFNETNAEKKRGIGVAVSYRGVSLGGEGTDAAGAYVSVQQDGSVIIHSGLVEMGQGLRTIYTQIVAEELGISADRIVFLDTDTSVNLDSGPTVASRSTIMGGSAMKDAAGRLRLTIHGVAADKLEVAQDDLTGEAGIIYSRNNPEKKITFEEAVRHTALRGLRLTELGWYQGPKVSWDEEHGQGDAYFTYVYAANVAEVEVDAETGQVEVLRFTAAHDVGRAINPENVRGQIYGGVAMALGYGLLEEVEMDKGVTRNLNFDEYFVATTMDVPDIQAIIVENPDEFGPYGAKSVGEPTLEIGAPAIANAIAFATGKRLRELPMDLERVLLGHSLRERRTKRGSVER